MGTSAKTYGPTTTFQNLPEEKRSRLVREATRLFAEKGYGGASLNVIVQRAGISKGSIYQYFENKEALFLYLFDEMERAIRQEVKGRAAGSEPLDFFERFREVLRAGVSFLKEYPHFFELYLKILFEDEIPAREELIRRMRLFSAEYFGPALEQAKDRGNIRRDLPAASVIFLLDAVIERFLQGCARSYLDSGLGLSRMDEESLEREIEILIGILKRGLLADDGRA